MLFFSLFYQFSNELVDRWWTQCDQCSFSFLLKADVIQAKSYRKDENNSSFIHLQPHRIAHKVLSEINHAIEFADFEIAGCRKGML